MEPLSKTITMSFKTFKHFNYHHMTRWSPFRRFLVFILYPILFLLSLPLLPGFLKNDDTTFVILISIFDATCLVLFSLYALRFAGLKKSFTSNQILQEPALFIFKDDGVRTERESSERFVPWDEIYKIRESKLIIALYLNRLQALVLPKSFFTADELNEIKNLLRHNIPKSKIQLK